MSVFAEGSLARQRLGAALKALRKDAGLTGPNLAAELKAGQSSVSRFEHGQSIPTDEQIHVWATATGAPSARRKELLALAAEAKAEQTTWARHLRRYGLVGMQRQVAVMERRAGVISVYQPVVVPGLLQTPEVVREVFTRRNPGRTDVDKAVAAALDRQAVLYDTTKTLQFVLGEVALRWLPVAPKLAAQQADRLLMLSEIPNITIGILPSDTAPGVWATHGFVLFDDMEGKGIGLGHLELRHDSLNIPDPAGVDEYREAFGDLLAAAVTGDDARALLLRIAQRLRA